MKLIANLITPKILCKYFNSLRGCKFGVRCRFQHSLTEKNKRSEIPPRFRKVKNNQTHNSNDHPVMPDSNIRNNSFLEQLKPQVRNNQTAQYPMKFTDYQVWPFPMRNFQPYVHLPPLFYPPQMYFGQQPQQISQTYSMIKPQILPYRK